MKEETDDVMCDEELSYIPPPTPNQEQIKINVGMPTKLETKKIRRIKMNELNMYGVDNLKRVGAAIASLVDAGVKSYSDDGKITFGDIRHFIKSVPEILAAIPAVNRVKAEITDKITQEELEDFKTGVLPYINIKNELDADFVNQLFDVLHGISRLVSNRIERKKEALGQ